MVSAAIAASQDVGRCNTIWGLHRAQANDDLHHGLEMQDRNDHKSKSGGINGAMKRTTVLKN